MSDWVGTIQEATAEIERLRDELATTAREAQEFSQELNVLQADYKELEKRPPEWGNCRRGCEPSYLDTEGFCSPSCAMGGQRGEYYSVASTQEVLKAHA